jgi:N-acetylmuramoyl-L-alanine amidase
MTVPNLTKRILPINHTKGRAGHAIDMITIHVTEGSASSVRSWFAAKEAQVSAHYMVCIDGTIDQFVDEEDQAWHNGRIDHPTAPLVLARPHVNPNAYSIGIEHEGTGNQPLMPAQRAASVELIRDICRRRSIPIDRTHIVGHHEVYSLKTCPGAIDVNALVLLVGGAAALLEAPTAPPVVWSGYLNDYLVVTRVVSDHEWYFVPMRELRTVAPTKSTQSLAFMPRTAP